MSHVAVPDASATVLPPAHCSDWPDGPATANVTVPVGVPAAAGSPTTVAVTASPPDGAAAGVTRNLTLDAPLDTLCVSVADDGATPELPG